MRLSMYVITGPDQIVASLIAVSPLAALRRFHADALGERTVRLRHGKLVFRHPADQALCAGTWTVCRRAVNGSDSSVTIEIPEPAAPD